MRTHEEPNLLNLPRLSLPRLTYVARKPQRSLRGEPAMQPTEPQPQVRLMVLMQEHRALDGAIAALFETGTLDEMLITRLKKRKLQLKDEIARLEGEVTAPAAS